MSMGSIRTPRMRSRTGGARLGKERSVGEIETFIAVLRAGCDEPAIRVVLERLLELPNEERVAFVEFWINDLKAKNAPIDFIEAIGCLHDTAIAEKAYEILFCCRR